MGLVVVHVFYGELGAVGEYVLFGRMAVEVVEGGETLLVLLLEFGGQLDESLYLRKDRQVFAIRQERPIEVLAL